MNRMEQMKSNREKRKKKSFVVYSKNIVSEIRIIASEWENKYKIPTPFGSTSHMN